MRSGRRSLRGLPTRIAGALALTLLTVTAAGGLASATPAAFAVGSVSTLGAARAATPDPTPSAGDVSGVQLSVSAGDAGLLQSGRPAQVQVTIANHGTTPLAAGTVVVGLTGQSINSRADLASWLAVTSAPTEVRQIGQVSTTLILPGDQAVVPLTIQPDQLGLSGYTDSRTFGLSAVFTARDSTIVGRGDVVWNQGTSGSISSVAVAMPLTVPNSSTGLISAADLTTYTSPTGILSRQLDGLMGHPTVAIGIDPMIIASIRVLGAAAPTSAQDWLKALDALPNDIFPLAFGDADLTGQLQAGAKAPLGPTSLDFALQGYRSPQTSVGEPTSTPSPTGIPTSTSTPTPTPTAAAGSVLPTLQELTAWKYTMSGIAWPAPDTVRSADLSSLAAAGLTTTILSSGNTDASGSDTPNALVPFSGGKAVVADAALSSALETASTAPNDAQWQRAMSRANADLQLIAAEHASGGRTLLIAFDRGSPSSFSQLSRTISDVETSPWASEVPLGDVLSTDPASGVTVKDMAEDGTRIQAIANLMSAEKSVDSFATVLQTPAVLTGQTRTQLLALLGVGWRADASAWQAAVAKQLGANQKTLASVTVLQSQNVNVVSSQGSIPFTVSNTGAQSVSVYLQASPSNNRLEIDNSVQKVVAADSRATVLVPVKARLGNGQVTLRLQLYSGSGVAIGGTTSVRVEVHADWEGIGAAIVGTALVLLFGFGIVRGILRRRRPEETEDGVTGDE